MTNEDQPVIQSIPAPDVSMLARERQQVSALMSAIGTLSVTNDTENAAAGEQLREVKSRQGQLDSMRKAMTRPLDHSKSLIMDLFRPVLDDLGEAEQHIKGLMVGYRIQEEQRIAHERAAAEAERRALEAEAMRQAEAGKYVEAIDAKRQSEQVAKPRPIKRPAGTSVVSRWKAEVEDFDALVLAVATGEAPSGLLKPDQQALDALARATKGDSSIEGVRFVEEKGMSTRGWR